LRIWELSTCRGGKRGHDFVIERTRSADERLIARSQQSLMNITVLTHLEKEGSRSHDVVVDQVAAALTEKGHQPTILGVHADIQKLITGLTQPRPDLVFNLMEMFSEDPFGDVDVAGLLDLLDLPHTGGGAGEIFLRQDKGLAKKLLAFDNILFPRFAVFPKNAGFETGGNLRMPLFIKPLRLDASLGIDAKSLCHDATAMMKKVLLIHEKFNDSALAEEFIEGREFYVGVLGNKDPLALPPIEMDFSGLPEGAPACGRFQGQVGQGQPGVQGHALGACRNPR
jgi:D-alanine-D-alanine ligase